MKNWIFYVAVGCSNNVGVYKYMATNFSIDKCQPIPVPSGVQTYQMIRAIK